MKPYSGTITGKSGRLYSVRFLLSDQVLDELTKEGLLPLDTCEIIGMQDAVNQATARFEMQSYLARGGSLQ